MQSLLRQVQSPGIHPLFCVQLRSSEPSAHWAWPSHIWSVFTQPEPSAHSVSPAPHTEEERHVQSSTGTYSERNKCVRQCKSIPVAFRTSSVISADWLEIRSNVSFGPGLEPSFRLLTAVQFIWAVEAITHTVTSPWLTNTNIIITLPLTLRASLIVTCKEWNRGLFLN